MAATAESLPNGIGNLSEIVLLEDEHIQEIKSALESIRCRVRLVSTREEAVKLAESGRARFFILDIRMGASRSGEGLDTLEEIKSIDETIYVAIYTVLERYEQAAANLGADLFLVKSRNKRQDMIKVAAKMLPYALAQLSTESRSKGEVVSDADEPEYSAAFATNLLAFRQSLANEEWLADNLGFYVAFVGGTIVRKEKERQTLLTWLSTHYADTPRFYMLVREEEQEPLEHLPSSLFIEDV